MTCEKHCLHWEVCKLTPPEYATAKYYTFCNYAERCECFKDKSKYIELPCKVGDTVYQTDTVGERIYPSKIKNIIFDTDGGFAFDQNAIGKSVFLTREEAEQRLEE